VWVGTSIENSRHTWRADVLRETPAALRFISAEPLLGSLYEGLPRDSRLREAPNVIVSGRMPLDLDEIDWLIVGGESGADARPMQVEWVRELRHDAVERGIPFFFKQWGGRTAKAGGKVLDGDEWCHFPASFGDLVPA
jgi:protein gp37